MDGGLVGGLNLDDVTGSALAIVEDVFVALDDVQIVVGDVLHVEAPAGVAARAEGVVDHVADGSDAHPAQGGEHGGLGPEDLVGPEEIGLFACGDVEQIAVEAIYGWAGSDAVSDGAEKLIGGRVVQGIEANDGVAEPFEGPETIERRRIR